MNQRRIHIKNLGRISEADIRLGGFTVLVGKNSTGKSFASKAIYSFLRAIDEIFPIHHHVDVLQTRLFRIVFFIKSRQDELQSSEKEQAISLQKQVESLFDLGKIADDSASAFIEHFEQKKESIILLQKKFNDMLNGKNALVHPSADSEKEDSEEEKMQRQLSLATDILDQLLRLSSISQEWVSQNMRDNLQNNFQTVHRDDIFRNKDLPITIELDGVAQFEWGSEDFVKCDSVDNLESFSSLISTLFFIESPVYLKLKSALDAASRDLHRRRFRAGLRKKALVPGYYADMHNDLAEALPTNENQEEFEKISNDISQAIGGNLRVTENDDIVFRSSTDEREHNIPLAATGIANFGMLGLLLEKQLLEKGSYLFIDEPEVHLHPEWVVQMADALLALVENGVNVVVATHSSVFLKWIEVKTEENPTLAEKFAINHFVDGKVVQDDTLDFEMMLNAVQVDISKPYGRLYMRGLGL